MATEKTLKTRLKMKHGKASEWALATKFTPLIGEIIVYDADETYTSPRFKVGDGLTNVNNLKFVNQDELAKITTLSDELTTVKNEYVPNTRTVNSKALSSNITLTASDVGAAASSHTHNYLPLTGGTLTGQLTVNSNHIAVKLNSNNSECQIRIQNSDNSENLFLYQNGDARGLYSMNSTGTGLAVLRAPTGTNNWTFNGNSLTATTATELTGVSPKLATSNDGNEVFLLSNTATFAEINSSSGRIAKALDFRHYNTHWRIGNLRGGGTDSVGFGFSYSSDNSTYTLPMYISTDGSIISKGLANVFGITSAAKDTSLSVQNSNGKVGLEVSTNRGLWDFTKSRWMIYNVNESDQVRIPAWASKGSSSTPIYLNADGYPVAMSSALPISLGGTGATTASGALANLAQVSANPRSCYLTYASLGETGVVSTASTTEEVGLAMADNTSVMFVHNADNTITLTDAPFNYGYIQLGRGYNQNYIYGWAYGTDGRVWSFSRHNSYAAQWRLVYNEKSVVYSSTQPSSASKGMIWLKPVS